MILRMHHAQITIPQGEENGARDFYCRLLGLKEIDRPEELSNRGGFWMEIANQQIHVGTESGVDRALTKAHIAYEVVDLPLLKKKLEDNGVKTKDGESIPGFDRMECRDPFGNRVEFLAKRN